MTSPNAFDQHHTIYPRGEMLKHFGASILRSYPWNIHETRRWRHQDLHAELGALAVPSDNFCREIMEWAGDLPSRAKIGKDRLTYYQAEIDLIEWLARVRNGGVRREADYFAWMLTDQLRYINPREDIV